MLYKFIIFTCFAFPFVGIVMMEAGSYGLSINEFGSRNYASEAFLAYSTVVFLTIVTCDKLGIFRNLGKGRPKSLPNPDAVTFNAIILFIPMLAFVLIVLGGLSTLSGVVSAGEFRAALGGGGALGYLIIKYFAPSIFSYALLTNVATNPRRLMSVPLIILGGLLLITSMSFGYKAAIVLALAPAAMLYFWKSSIWCLVPLAAGAMALIIFGYMFFQDIPTIGEAFQRLTYRLFILQGDVAWKVWDIHASGAPLPPYGPTLPPIVGDRIFSFLTQVTRADPEAWVATHFGLMVTHLSGYSYETIMAGHNNTATVFSEGLIAGGLVGLFGFAVLAGLIIQALYRFIDNRLRANDFIAASIGASYTIMGLMAWLIGGGITAIVHLSIFVAFVSTFILLRLISVRRRRSDRTQPA